MNRIIATTLLFTISFLPLCARQNQYGTSNPNYRHGRYATGSSTRGRSRAVYSSRTGNHGKGQRIVGYRSKGNPKVVVMTRRAR